MNNQNAFIQYIHDRIFIKKMDFLFAVVGERGVGKSLSVISLLKMLDPTFEAKRVIYSYNDLIDIADSNKYKPGSAFLFDEITADAMQARNFMSKQNKGLSALMQTFRNKRYIIAITTPSLKFLDVQAKALLHMIMVCSDKVPRHMKEDFRLFYVYIVSAQPLDISKSWYMHPQYKIGNHFCKGMSLLIPKPDEQLVEEYEKLKSEFQHRLHKKLRDSYNDGFGKRQKYDYQYIDLDKQDADGNYL